MCCNLEIPNNATVAPLPDNSRLYWDYYVWLVSFPGEKKEATSGIRISWHHREVEDYLKGEFPIGRITVMPMPEETCPKGDRCSTTETNNG